MRLCSVAGCDSKIQRGIKVFHFPTIYNQTETFKKLSKQRQLAWLSALGKTDADPNSSKRIRVCGDHFISGKSAAFLDINNLDWVPKLNLQNSTSRCTDILRCSIDGCTVSNQGDKSSFYQIPKINEHGELKQLSVDKVSEWISTLGKSNDDQITHENVYVCQAHYVAEISGKLRDTSDSDIICLDSDSTESATSFENGYESDHCNELSSLDKNLNRNQLLSQNQPPSTTTNKDLKSFKSGEILRNENGQFSFSCSYCGALSDDCREMIDHIDAHFDTNDKNMEFEMSTSPQPSPLPSPLASPLPSPLASPLPSPLASPEFVSCTYTNFKTEPECSETFRELTNTMPTSKASKDSDEVFTVKLEKSETSPPLKRRFDQLQNNIAECTTYRPFKIRLVQPVTSNTKDVPIRPKLLPVLAGSIQSNPPIIARSAGWSFGKNYQIMYKSKNANVNLTSSKDLGKEKYVHIQQNLLQLVKCYQCNVEPAVNESDPRPHKCKDCGEWLANHIAYKSHIIETHYQVKSTKCYQCESEPAITNELDPRRHKCLFCKQWFPNHIEFKTHFKDVHNKNVDTYFGWLSECREYTCYICEKSLKQREYLVTHMKSHFDKYLEHQCHKCGLRVRTESVLKEHMKRHVKKTSKCDLCNKVFPNQFRMRTHRLCHTSELNYVCTVCSKGFKLNKYLRRHMAVHEEVKIFCRYCDASFKFSTGRRAHEKSQHNVV